MSANTYLINQATNKKYRLNGIFPSKRQPENMNLQDNFGAHMMYDASELPPRVDLRADMTTVEDQSSIASCGANALAGAYEYLIKKSEGRAIDVSRLFIYYNARVQDFPSEPVSDSGCSMTSIVEALKEKGVCDESIWPYDITKVDTRPSDEAYTQGESLKITEALSLNIELNELKSCLAQGFPFAFGLTLFGSFDRAAETGIVPMPAADDTSRTSHGFHAMLAVGYSDQTQAFIVRNSWGETWGEKGYCYIPYDYMTNSEYSFDFWTVKKISIEHMGKDSWHETDFDKKAENENVYYDDSAINYLIETYPVEDNYNYDTTIYEPNILTE